MYDPASVDDLVFPGIDRGDLEPYAGFFNQFSSSFDLCE